MGGGSAACAFAHFSNSVWPISNSSDARGAHVVGFWTFANVTFLLRPLLQLIGTVISISRRLMMVIILSKGPHGIHSKGALRLEPDRAGETYYLRVGPTRWNFAKT